MLNVRLTMVSSATWPDVPPSNPLALVNTSKEMQERKTPVVWSKLEEKVLVDVLDDFFTRGATSENGWKDTLFNSAMRTLLETPPEEGPVKDKDACSNKYLNCCVVCQAKQLKLCFHLSNLYCLVMSRGNLCKLFINLFMIFYAFEPHTVMTGE